MCAKLDTTGLLADVTLSVFRGSADAGRERCHLYRRADGGYWMTSDLDWTLPLASAQYVEARAGADWRIESLDVRLSGGEQRDASYHVDGLTLRATIQTNEATVERAVPFGPDTLVDFDSVWLVTLALNRLALAPGQAREVDVIRIEPPLLEPVTARRRYECIGLERVITPVGEWDATWYVIGGAYHLWTDSRGIVVATRRTMQETTCGHALLEYHWLG